ncbi:MAG TPA: ABC transporter substrate-binding protein, partial [Methylomirabilota bacterium]|nr:ABC transporter substrate-binding protein [Methylomirabilota bacterium]
MGEVSRRTFLAGAAAAAATLAAPAVHAQKRGGTLRFIPHADLKILDPIWTTAYITRNHGYMVYDTLFALDADLRVRPQMVERHTVSRDGMKYSFTLRDGLRFHDGQPVTAEDCVASIRRWGARDAVGRLLLAAVGKLAPADRKTFILELAQPFGLVVDGLAKPSASPCFVMPARLAATDPNEQVKETIGSGPYRFVKDEWQPGNQVVYTRNPDYVPRGESPSGAAGGKRVFLDRVLWRYIPDAATAGAALDAGEVDYWENPPLDFVPRLEQSASLAVFVTDPRGTQGLLRPNHMQPPFNDKKARQALLWMVDQEVYLRAAIGQARYYRPCPGYFMCGGLPYESAVAAPPKPDLERARRLLKASGYD